MSRGIGRGIAEELGRHGAAVAVDYRFSEGAAHDVVDAIEAEGRPSPSGATSRTWIRSRGCANGSGSRQRDSSYTTGQVLSVNGSVDW